MRSAFVEGLYPTVGRVPPDLDHGLSFALKATQRRSWRPPPMEEELDRHELPLGILGLEDAPHGTLAELPEDDVGTNASCGHTAL
jgi:hypothetical protein